MSAAGSGAGAPGAGDQPPLPGTQPPPAAAPPPPAAPPPAAPARAAGGQNQRRDGKRRDRHARRNQPQQAPFDQNPAVMKRIRQEASRILRRELGEDLTMEQIKELVAKAKASPPGTPAAAPAAQGPSARERKLQEERDELAARVSKQNRKLKKLRTRNERDATRSEMRLEARSAGIADRYFNFAMTELGEYLTAYGSNPESVPSELKAALAKEPDIDAKTVFAYIKAQHPMIAEQPPTVVPISPTTAPPASRQPGERTSPPAPTTPKQAGFDASKLSPEEWSDYKRRNGLRF